MIQLLYKKIIYGFKNLKKWFLVNKSHPGFYVIPICIIVLLFTNDKSSILKPTEPTKGAKIVNPKTSNISKTNDKIIKLLKKNSTKTKTDNKIKFKYWFKKNYKIISLVFWLFIVIVLIVFFHFLTIRANKLRVQAKTRIANLGEKKDSESENKITEWEAKEKTPRLHLLDKWKWKIFACLFVLIFVITGFSFINIFITDAKLEYDTISKPILTFLTYVGGIFAFVITISFTKSQSDLNRQEVREIKKQVELIEMQKKIMQADIEIAAINQEFEAKLQEAYKRYDEIARILTKPFSLRPTYFADLKENKVKRDEEYEQALLPFSYAISLIPEATNMKVVRATFSKESGKVIRSEDYPIQKLIISLLSINKKNLVGVDLANSNLIGINLQNSDLRGSLFDNAKLQGAYLYKSNLQGAHLRNTNLQGANLSYANLQGAELWESKLQGAYLGFSKLQGSNKFKLNLKGSFSEYSNAFFTYDFLKNLKYRTGKITELDNVINSGFIEEIKNDNSKSDLNNVEKNLSSLKKIQESLEETKNPNFKIIRQFKIAYNMINQQSYKIQIKGLKDGDFELRGAITGRLTPEESQEIYDEYNEALGKPKEKLFTDEELKKINEEIQKAEK